MLTIDMKNIRKKYGSREILKDLELHIEQGEFVAVVGSSGSGKSTLINIIGLLDEHFEGEYTINGINVKKCNSEELSIMRNKQIGFVFQMYNLIGGYTVKENILLPAVLHKNKVELEYYNELLEMLNITNLSNHLANDLSGGEKQRVAIARAVINKPQLIIADEPTGNLDPANTKSVMDMFEYLTKKNVTMIMVTHDYNAARRAKRVLTISDGGLVCH